jgi:eukaryotic-like serine/threonine-protein kinase
VAHAVQRTQFVVATIQHTRRGARRGTRTNGHRNGHTNGENGRGRRILGRYRLVMRLAVGGTAEIWRAIDERTGRGVAVKLLHPHLLPDPASRARLAAEARAVSSLDHPGIVRLIAADSGEQPAVVLELVKGEPLPSRLARATMVEPHEAARIGAEIAEALYHAHTRGVIHRDVKSGNVLLGSDGHARLVDFGIARMLGEAIERTTQTGTVMGTLRYMAPEQLAGREVGPRVDLYGLGSVMHEMLTGSPPYDGTSPVALLEEQAKGPPRLRGIDPALAAVVRACLQPRPEDRPLHAGLVAAALRAWLAGDPAPALAVGAPASPEELDTRPMAVAIIPEPERSARHLPLALRGGLRRPSRAAMAMASVGLLALGALGVAALRPVSGTAEARPAPTAAPTPVPAWAAQLADRYAEACGTGPTPRELAAMGRAAAQAMVDAAVKSCEQESGGGGGGDGKGHGHGHGGGG